MLKHTIFTYLLLSFTLLACSIEQEANNNEPEWLFLHWHFYWQ